MTCPLRSNPASYEENGSSLVTDEITAIQIQLVFWWGSPSRRGSENVSGECGTPEVPGLVARVTDSATPAETTATDTNTIASNFPDHGNMCESSRHRLNSRGKQRVDV